MASTTRPWFVYALRDPRNGSIRYIGATGQSLHARLAQHLHAKLKIDNRKTVWIRELRTIGLRPEILAMETVEDRAYSRGHARAREAVWIDRVLVEGADLTNRHNVLRGPAGDGPGRRLLNLIHARGLTNPGAGRALGVTANTIWTWIMEFATPEPAHRERIHRWSDGAIAPSDWTPNQRARLASSTP